MKTFLLAASLFLCAGLMAAPSVTITSTGIPAFIGRDDLPNATVIVKADTPSKGYTLNIPLEGVKPADVKIRLTQDKETFNGKGGMRNAISFKVPLVAGENKFDLCIAPSSKFDIKKKIIVDGTPIRVGSCVTSPNQKISDASNRPCRNFRIPGIAQTPKGTLVAVFDNRYNHNGDLPADITVGVSTSTDKGRTWSPIRTALNYKDKPIADGGQGIGDPCILVDPSNGRIWIAALRSPKTGHPIFKSRTGSTSRNDCGGFILAYSDDEGKKWSKPIDITDDVKRLSDPDTKEWGCVFQGPGNGMAMKNGTLVFPAQVWGNNGSGPHHALLVYSKDHGKTWTSSKAMPFGGSETTCAELSDGSIMLNAREGGGGNRSVGITKDMGATWTRLDTPSSRLRQPVCQAALLRVGKDLYFSNPNSGGRDTMTIRHSSDDGKSWKKSVVYDPRGCAGYSSLCTVDKDTIGVLYEGKSDYLYFLSIPLSDLE